jgi:hypothetical protein
LAEEAALSPRLLEVLVNALDADEDGYISPKELLREQAHSGRV